MNGCSYRKRQKYFRRRQGSSITEVLVALFILAVFVSGAAKVIMSTYQVSDKAGDHYTAINIAKNRIEHLRNMRRASYDQIYLMQETDEKVNDDGEHDINGHFSRTTEINATAVPELLEIKVTVKIKNRKTLLFGQERQYVSSYMAKLLES